MTDKDMRMLRTYASNDMQIGRTSRTLHMTYNNVLYHLNRIHTKTGLNPRRFWDLVELLGIGADDDE